MTRGAGTCVYVAGVLVGIPGFFFVSRVAAGESVVKAVLQLGLAFMLLGFVGGAVVPAGRWQWGVALALPLLAALAFSVVFAGQLDAFVTHDAPLVMGVIGGGMLGGEVGARTRRHLWPAA